VHVAVHYRRVLFKHPNLAPLVAARPLPQDDWFAPAEMGIALFRDIGIDEELIPQAVETVTTFMLGYVVHEIGRRRYLADLGEDSAARIARIGQGIERLGGPDSLLGKVLAFQQSDDAEIAEQTYVLGMRALIDGLRTPRRAPAPRG